MCWGVPQLRCSRDRPVPMPPNPASYPMLPLLSQVLLPGPTWHSQRPLDAQKSGNPCQCPETPMVSLFSSRTLAK